MKDNLIISISPHRKEKADTPRVMRGVVYALMPAVIASIYYFKLRAFLLIIVCIAGTVLTEAVFQKLRRRPITIKDGSALLTGLLLALVLPPSLPLWAGFLGAVMAIVIGKQIFGGLGQNIFNPALIGRAFLMATFPVMLTTWIKPGIFDAVTTATPLSLFKFDHNVVSTLYLLLGNTGGSLGETCAIVLIIGGIFLLIKKYMDWRIPLSYIGTVLILTTVLYLIKPAQYASPLFHLFAGGLMLGALFMATDPVTSPITKKGRYIFGVGCGFLVVIIRTWGGLPEGVMYSILLMNAFTPLINRYTVPVQFGGRKK
ncbi:MAG: RnfABCDGE type electron transport complex subunit D [Candidatus Cloacimonadota bacterium]|nr:MAG: RnfABCDGE type electron transport complex subunit D [Candidatus Cloacimonadota bacterium]